MNNIVLLGDYNRDLVLQSDGYSQHDISKALDSNGRFAGGLHANAMVSSSFCTKYDKETE